MHHSGSGNLATQEDVEPEVTQTASSPHGESAHWPEELQVLSVLDSHFVAPGVQTGLLSHVPFEELHVCSEVHVCLSTHAPAVHCLRVCPLHAYMPGEHALLSTHFFWDASQSCVEVHVLTVVHL